MALTIAQIQAALTAPKTFNSLTSMQQTDVVAALKNMAGQPFTSAQRTFLQNCWLLVTQAQVDAANAVLSANVKINPYSLAGQLYIGFDLVLDAIDTDSPYHPFLNAAKAIPVQYTTAIVTDAAAKYAALPGA